MSDLRNEIDGLSTAQKTELLEVEATVEAMALHPLQFPVVHHG